MARNRKSKDRAEKKAPLLGPWEGAALLATIALLLAPILYFFRSDHVHTITEAPATHFVGSAACRNCHKDAFAKWQGSDHDKAMAVATNDSVLGDFSGVTYYDPYNKVTSRFFKIDQKFYVETEGAGGNPARYELTYTFGVYPLQQYLAPFPGGRLQCLNIAWDVEKRTWYRLPPYEVKGPDDWLHWTKGGQTWNAMCAECHSTRVKKNFAIKSNNYNTSWFEINVGCEACHGPGSDHVTWAGRAPLARPTVTNYGLSVITAQLTPERQLAICAPCHSRRFQLGDNDHSQGTLLDKMVPSLLEEGLYFPDGQILDEVYVYGSFTQSKMYQKGIRCSDCHDIHSLQLHREKNKLCLACHRAEVYDTPTHHFHKKEYQGKPSEGYLCVKCHMPGRTYMGIDYRPDHSLRIPRPDLTQSIGTPNSCSTIDCHGDKPLDWVVSHYDEWYGKKRKPHFGETFALARRGSPNAGESLRKMAADSLLPVIVRATALSLLQNYPGPETIRTFTAALEEDDALLRYTALRNVMDMPQEMKLSLIAPKLYDKVKAVRIEAAYLLASLPVSALRPADREQFQLSLREYREAMLYNADFAAQRYNLGNLAAALGKGDEAKSYYQQAIAIDNQFFPAKVHLAMQYNRTGENKKAEQLLREVVRDNPNLYEVSYSLGLLLAEMNNYSEAAVYLGQAADGMPAYSRARYNQALALLKLGRTEEGEKALLQALEVDSQNRQYFTTIINFYLGMNQKERARQLAEGILAQHPDHAEAQEILRLLKQSRQ